MLPRPSTALRAARLASSTLFSRSNPEASMLKLYTSELQQRIASTYIHLLGPYGLLSTGSAWGPDGGRHGNAYVSAVSATIAGGTSEVQRGIIATRGLGLPKN